MNRDMLDFIRNTFRSVWSLELMIFMQRCPDRAWEINELVRALRGSLPVVTQGLVTLQAAGLVVSEPDEKYRYAPASPALAQLAEALEQIHREKPITVHQAILSGPNERLYTLADAFKIKKE